jgi:large subunit ribosomal protein L21
VALNVHNSLISRLPLENFPLPLPPEIYRVKFNIMIAVVKIAGQQFKVEKDQTLYVPHVEGNAGDKLDLEVLMVDADGKLSAGNDVKAKVKAEIVDHVKGDTVIAYKQKRRKGFHKKKGHRTAYTKIKVTSIN